MSEPEKRSAPAEALYLRRKKMMLRKDTFRTSRYKGYWIHTHYEYERGSLFGREVVKVQDPENLSSRLAVSVRAAKLLITKLISASSDTVAV